MKTVKIMMHLLAPVHLVLQEGNQLLLLLLLLQTEKKQTWKTVKQQNSAKIPLWPGALPDSDAIGLPIHYFRVFFDADRLDNVVEQSNLYSTQQNPTKLDQNELEQFIGAVVYMSDFHLRRSRMYRSSGCQVPQVADTMSRDRWEQI